ncbi:unnamed protein product [Urochloa decumbens]|uniref:Uncharacterized protein n=1 Tax=Urochloa decumbens TaxID=240449 RepID=A0ABC9ATE7_9POAL
MASAAAIRRCAARSLRLRLWQPLEQQLCPLERRCMSSSVPTERNKCSSSSDTCSRGSMEQNGHMNEKKEDIYQRLSTKIDKISDGLDEHERFLKLLYFQIQENNKHRGTFDLTPWAMSMSASFFVVALYNYIQG